MPTIDASTPIVLAASGADWEAATAVYPAGAPFDPDALRTAAEQIAYARLEHEAADRDGALIAAGPLSPCPRCGDPATPWRIDSFATWYRCPSEGWRWHTTLSAVDA